MNLSALLSWLSASSITISILLVIVLHRVEPDFEPSWRMLSEYSLGRFGWLMRMAFIVGAVGVTSSSMLIFEKTPVGSLALIATAIGPFGAAFVDTDPITTPRHLISNRSKVHSALGSLFILGFPMASTFAGVTSGIDFLGWASILPWLGLIYFLAATVRNASPDGAGGPQNKIGWPNRISMLTYLSWSAAVVLVSLS